MAQLHMLCPGGDIRKIGKFVALRRVTRYTPLVRF
jgi:hypothetical protein